MTSGPAASDSRQGRAAKLLGAYLHSPGKPEWRAWCPVHEAERITHGLPCEKDGRHGSPSLAILPDGDNGYPRYECVSRDCHTANTMVFLAAVQTLVGNDLVWSPEPRLALVTGDEGDAESNPLPSREELDHWQGNLLEESQLLSEEAERYIRYLHDQCGMSTPDIRNARLGLANFTYSQRPALVSAGMRLVVPVWDEGGSLATVRLWNPLHPKKSQRVRNWTGHGAAGLLGAHKVTGWPADEPILFCEGEGDYLAATAAGFHAVTGTGGAGTPPLTLSALRGRDVVIVYDNDPAGSAGGDKLAAALADYRARPYLAHIGEVLAARGSDVRDLLHVEDGADILRGMIGKAVGAGSWTPESAEVRKEAERERVRQAARRTVREEAALADWEVPPSIPNLAAVLEADRPLRPMTIEGLHYTGTNTVIISGYKTGKTTLALNLLKSLADGEKFLGRYEVNQPAGRVAWWNGELTLDTAIDWLRDLSFSNVDRLALWPLRGHSLPLRSELGAQTAVRWLLDNDVKLLVIDPVAALFDGEENSNDDMREWCRALDRVKRLAGVEDLFLVVHTGRAEQAEGSERARGATRLDDWADTRWLYNRSSDGRSRYLRAHGRDVDEPNFPIAYDYATRHLRREGDAISRRAAEQQAGIDKVTRALSGLQSNTGGPGPSKNQLVEALGPGKTDIKRTWIDAAETAGRIAWKPGSNNRHHYHLVPKDKLRLPAEEASEHE